MAIGTTKDTTQGAVDFKKYIGVATVRVLAVNPTAKELSAIYGREVEKEPEYIGTAEWEHPVTGEKKMVKSIRLDFILNNEELDLTTKMSFFFQQTPFISKDGKCQVIDKFGRTAWVTSEQFKNKEIPVYSNGPARIDAGYKTAYKNEESLIKFFRKLFGVPEVDTYKSDTGTWETIADTESALMSIDSWDKIFADDLSEIKSYLNIAPDNKVKVLLGIRTKDGVEYQDVYNAEFMSNKARQIPKSLINSVEDSQRNGMYPNTYFVLTDVQEYSNALTTKSVSKEEDPFW